MQNYSWAASLSGQGPDSIFQEIEVGLQDDIVSMGLEIWLHFYWWAGTIELENCQQGLAPSGACLGVIAVLLFGKNPHAALAAQIAREGGGIRFKFRDSSLWLKNVIYLGTIIL